MLAWNKAAEEVFAFSRLPEEDRNILIIILTKPATRRVFGAGWNEQARRVVAQFRATHDLWADDPAFVELLARRRVARARSSRSGGRPTTSAPAVSGRKQMSHPKKGLLRFEHASFQASDDPALKLIIYTPV